ncbi:MAG: 4Fe-4S dicluster domain-containing protein [Wolinella sp.]
MDYKGWNEFEIGSLLFPFKEDAEAGIQKHPEERAYNKETSYTASTAHWRVDKPVYNPAGCINCYFCWLYCPDSSILVRDEKMRGIDYTHCKGCGVCVSVCPSNPKSLLMFSDHESEERAIASWPAKEERKRD